MRLNVSGLPPSALAAGIKSSFGSYSSMSCSNVRGSLAVDQLSETTQKRTFLNGELGSQAPSPLAVLLSCTLGK